MRIVFAPVGIVVGLVAGFAAKKVFEGVWGMLDEEEPPDPEDREISYPKMAAALALEGGIFRLAKGMADHGTRAGFARLTGTWPGEQRPD